MSNKKKLALIGAGAWGKNFIKELNKSDCFDLLCVLSSNPETSQLVSEKTTIVKDFASLIKFKPDGVIIASPPETHFNYVRQCFELSLPVLCEKPITDSLKKCLELKSIQEKFQGKILVDYIYLYHPCLIAFENYIKEHAITIHSIESYLGNYGPFRSYSALLDYGPHELAIVEKFLNCSFQSPVLKVLESNTLLPGSGIFEIQLNSEVKSARMVFGNLFKTRQRKVVFKSDNCTIVFEENPTPLLYVDKENVQTPIPFLPISPLTSVLNSFLELLNGKSNSELSFSLKIWEKLESLMKEKNNFN